MNIDAILSKIEVLPSMPAVTLHLLEAAQDENAGLATLAGWIEKDQAMTVNLLRLCNSPFYGLRREVTSIRQAASLLGMKQVIQIAITILASRHLAGGHSGYDLATGELWKSSITAAVAAEVVAQEVHYANQSTAYTAGLLQDVGKIILSEFVQGVVPKILALVEHEQISFQEAEHRVVGMNHAEVGARLLELWGFPGNLVESVRLHHEPERATIDAALTRISHLADALTMTVGMGLGSDGLAYKLDDRSVAALKLDDPRRLETLVETLTARISQADDLLRVARKS